MSWKIINVILCLATVDREFRQALLAEPLAPVQADLTVQENEAVKLITTTSLSDFRQQLIALLSEKDDPVEGG